MVESWFLEIGESQDHLRRKEELVSKREPECQLLRL